MPRKSNKQTGAPAVVLQRVVRPQPAIIHAPGQVEHSLCGMAFDAYGSGDSEEPIVMAEIGQLVTCEECRREIDYVRQSFKRYRHVAERSGSPTGATTRRITMPDDTKSESGPPVRAGWYHI